MASPARETRFLPWAGPAAIIILVLLAVLVALVIWADVALVRSGRSGRAGKENGAMAIVKERYARGETSKEEFDQMRKDLHQRSEPYHLLCYIEGSPDPPRNGLGFLHAGQLMECVAAFALHPVGPFIGSRPHMVFLENSTEEV